MQWFLKFSLSHILGKYVHMRDFSYELSLDIPCSINLSPYNRPFQQSGSFSMNIIRSVLLKRRSSVGLPIETGSGGRTKFNRTQQGFEKTHWIDAACVGASTPKKLNIKGIKPLYIKATGHGSRQMCRVDTYGFPRTGPKKGKKHYGFQTGDIVKAVVLEGKKRGTHMGKVAVRTNGFFNITHASGVVQGNKHTYCKLIHKSDGYSYSFLPVLSTHKTQFFNAPSHIPSPSHYQLLVSYCCLWVEIHCKIFLCRPLPRQAFYGMVVPIPITEEYYEQVCDKFVCLLVDRAHICDEGWWCAS